MRLAAELGLDVAPVQHRYCPAGRDDDGHEAIFLVRRFDRRWDGEAVGRLPAIDACQLLNVDATYKYREMSAAALRRVAEATRSRAAARVRLFRWSLFNAIVGDRDAHLKNLSFLRELPRHRARPALRPGEHCDLRVAATLARDGDVDCVRGGAGSAGALDRDGVLELGRELLIAPKAATATLDRMVRAMPEAADRVIAQFEGKPFPDSAAAVRAGELRVLRQIRHVAIAELVKRL